MSNVQPTAGAGAAELDRSGNVSRLGALKTCAAKQIASSLMRGALLPVGQVELRGSRIKKGYALKPRRQARAAQRTPILAKSCKIRVAGVTHEEYPRLCGPRFQQRGLTTSQTSDKRLLRQL